ncbi:hypothetical protein pb186bvf_002379 [Paramecium bursaria]
MMTKYKRTTDGHDQQFLLIIGNFTQQCRRVCLKCHQTHLNNYDQFIISDFNRRQQIS